MMRNRKTCRRLAGAAGALLLMGIVFLSLTSPLKAQAVDLTANKSIKVTLPDLSGEKEDMETVAMTVDVYQVATAQAVTGYDTYEFVIAPDFNSLSTDLTGLVESETKDAQELSADFADDAAALIKKNSIKPLKTAAADKNAAEFTELPAGLYLVLAHGDLTDYFSTVEEGDNKGKVITIAQSPKYTYSFLPVLLSLPFKGTAGTVSMTSDPVKWEDAAEIELKAERELRFTEFQIKKVLQSYEDRQPTTFVFEIKYKDENGKDVTRIESMMFSKAELQTVKVENIPVGTDVTVTEVYSGANYVVSGSASQELENIQVPANETEVNGVTFLNDYNKTDKGGGSIKNAFNYIEGDEGTEGHWNLTPVYDDPADAPVASGEKE